MRKRVPDWVPGGTRRTTRLPVIVSTDIFDPRIAWAMLTRFLTCTSRPSRRKRLWGRTLKVMTKSPGAPPFSPRSPWPVSRTFEPVSTPGGTAT